LIHFYKRCSTVSSVNMSSLSCVKNQVPASLSLQSVGVRPADYEPGYAALTVRVGAAVRAELRVVHGGEELHRAIKAAVEKCFGVTGSVEDDMGSLGYWVIRLENTLMVEKERNKFLLFLFSHCTKESWEVVSSCKLTPNVETDQVCELFTWFLKRNVNTPPSSDCCLISTGKGCIEVLGPCGENLIPVNNTVKNAIDAFEDKQRKGKVSESGYISEEDKKDSKNSSTEKVNQEVSSEEDHRNEKPEGNSKDKLNTGDCKIEETEKINLSNTDLQSPSSPDMLEEIDKEIRSSVENLVEKEDESKIESENQNLKVSDIIEAVEKQSPNTSKDLSPKKISEVQKNKSLIANIFGNRPISPNVSKLPQDDPQCPSTFNLVGTKIFENSEFLVDLFYQLFCRQWKLVTSVKTDSNSLIFFRHDSRILPGLGQQAFSGFSVDSSGTIFLFNASNEIIENMKLFADEVHIESKTCKFRIKEDTSLTKGKDLLTEIVTIFNNYQFSILGSIDLELNDLDANLLLFKPSTVSATNILGLSLGQGNVLTLTGGTEEEINVLRETVLSRWPYPIVSDMAISSDSWSWKVKRYPWRMSYGSKMVDRAVDRATKLVRQLSFPPPNNTDLESAKSLVVFIMKELAEKSWKFIGASNLTSSACLLHFSR